MDQTSQQATQQISSSKQSKKCVKKYIKKTKVVSDKPKFSFKTWYETNKAKISEARKIKYHNDPNYRATLKAQATKYRHTRPKTERKVSTKITIPILCNAAECSVHTYRKYCQLGWIPTHDRKSDFSAKHVELLGALCVAARDSKYMRKGRDEYLHPFIVALQKDWY